MLAYCCPPSRPERPRLTRRELLDSYPQLRGTSLTRTRHADYYLDRRKDKTRLTRIVVDLGGDHLRLVRKLREILRANAERPSFGELMQDDAFAFAVVTAEPSKKEAIKETLARNPISPIVLVATVADLSDLL